MEDASVKKGPLGGQLYEAKLQLDARVMRDGSPAYSEGEATRRLNEIARYQEEWASRKGQFLTQPVVTKEDLGFATVYTISRDGFPKIRNVMEEIEHGH